MLPNPAKSQTNTIPPTPRREKLFRPINKIRTPRETGSNRSRLFCILRVVITVKKDKTVKIALDAKHLNENSVKKRPHMPTMEELLKQISAELPRNDHGPIWKSVIDLDYAYRQMKLAPETSKHCNFAVTGKNLNGYYRFLKGFYGPAKIPTILQEKIDRTLGHQTLVWLDDIFIVTREQKKSTPENYFRYYRN